MYEIYNPDNGVTLGWSRTMMGAWRMSKMFDAHGIPNKWLHDPVKK